MLGQIDARCDRARADETDEVRPEPNSDLEQALAPGSGEIGETVDVGIELVPRSLDLSVELRGAFWGRHVLGAARVLLPEISDALLLIYCRRRRGHRLGLYSSR